MKKIILLTITIVFMATLTHADMWIVDRANLWKSKALDATGVQIKGWKPNGQIIENPYGVKWWKVDAMIMPETYNGETANPVWNPYHTKEMNACGCYWRYQHWVETFFPASGPWWVAVDEYPNGVYAEVISINGAPWCKVGRVMIPENWPFKSGLVAPATEPGEYQVYRRKAR